MHDWPWCANLKPSLGFYTTLFEPPMSPQISKAEDTKNLKKDNTIYLCKETVEIMVKEPLVN